MGQQAPPVTKEEQAEILALFAQYGTAAKVARKLRRPYHVVWECVDRARKSGVLGDVHKAITQRVVDRMIDQLIDANDTASSRISREDWCERFPSDPTAGILRGMSDAVRTIQLAKDKCGGEKTLANVNIIVQRAEKPGAEGE